jgi:hypothetical protein
MNKGMLAKSVGKMVRLEPKPKHHDADVDPDWHIANASSKGIDLTHLGTQQKVHIRFDLIHEYVSPSEGETRGCLYLYARVFVGDPNPKVASLSPAERRALYGDRSVAVGSADVRGTLNLVIAEIGRNKRLRGRATGHLARRHLDRIIELLEGTHAGREPLETLYGLRQRTDMQKVLSDYPSSVGHQHQERYLPAAEDAIAALQLFLARMQSPSGFEVRITRDEIDDIRLGERLRRVEEADCKARLLVQLHGLREEGSTLLARITHTPAPAFVPFSGSTAPATVPIDNEDGQDITRWRERVASLLLTADKRLGNHFTGCRSSAPPHERLTCHLERLDRVLDELRADHRLSDNFAW